MLKKKKTNIIHSSKIKCTKKFICTIYKKKLLKQNLKLKKTLISIIFEFYKNTIDNPKIYILLCTRYEIQIASGLK